MCHRSEYNRRVRTPEVEAECSPGDAARRALHVSAAAGQDVLGRLAGGSGVYVYFNNDAHGHAVRNAQRLVSFLPEESPA